MVVQYVSKVNQKEGRKGAAKIVGEHAVNNGANLGYEIDCLLPTRRTEDYFATGLQL